MRRHGAAIGVYYAGRRCTCARRASGKGWGAQGDAAWRGWLTSPVARQMGRRSAAVIGGLIPAQAAQHVEAGVNARHDGRTLPAPRKVRETLCATLASDGRRGLMPDEGVWSLLNVWRYAHFDEAIRLANNTRFGLSWPGGVGG